nr:hypothetical protein [Tanacetum cinerariifolium]
MGHYLMGTTFTSSGNLYFQWELSPGSGNALCILFPTSVDKPLVDSVDIDIPREDGNGYIMANIRIKFEWQPPRCGTCKIFDHLDSVCPMKRLDSPLNKCVMHAYEVKDKQHVQATGRKGKGNSNIGQSLDTTKKPSPSNSSLNGKSSYDDISLQELRKFVNKSIQDESVLEQIGNYDINGCTSREKQGEQVLSKKPSSSMEVLNEDSDTDGAKVFIPKHRTTFPSSSGIGGQPLEEDAYDDYEDKFVDYPSLHQVYGDHFDFKYTFTFVFWINSWKRVLALEEAKTTQDKVITKLKLRVKRLEKKRKASTSQPMKMRLFKSRVETFSDKILGEDASKQGRNDDKTKEFNLTEGANTKVVVEDKGSDEKGSSTTDQVSTVRPEVSTATPSTPPTTTTIFSDKDLTIA